MSKHEGIKYLSVSQLKTHELNPLHWILNKVLKMRTPETEATSFGGKFHDEVEKALKGESDPTMPEVIEFLKLWQEQDQFELSSKEDVEHQFKTFKIAEDLPPFMGIIDVLVREPTLRIIDHKTVGTKKYALKQEDLKYDDQLILYSYYALTHVDPTATEIIVQHNQWFKKAKRDKFAMIQDTLTREHVMEHIEAIRTKARALVKTYEAYMNEGLHAVTNTVDKCRFAFGGCPYRPICEGHMSPEEYKSLQERGFSAASIETTATNAFLAEKVFAKKHKKCYNKSKEKTKDTKPMKQNSKAPTREELLVLIKEADDTIINSGKAKNQFDHRKLVAQEVVNIVKDRGLQSILIPLYLVIGSDPDVTPVLTALKKESIELIHKIA